jgi:hypothetical protein
MLEMVLHLYLGWLITGTSGKSLNSSRMVLVGTPKVIDIVTTTNI